MNNLISCYDTFHKLLSDQINKQYFKDGLCCYQNIFDKIPNPFSFHVRSIRALDEPLLRISSTRVLSFLNNSLCIRDQRY